MSELPSVTRILQAVGLAPDFTSVPAATLEHARIRGTALHLAIRYYHEGTLDESSLHEEIVPGFEAYRRFVKATDHDPIMSEMELTHPQWGFRGHPDRVGICNELRSLVDFKYTRTFATEYVRLQLAGYRLLWNATYPDRPIERSYGLHLKRDGTYALHELTDSEAENIFLAAVVVYRAREKQGRINGSR